MTNQQHPITPPPELVQQWAHMLEQHTDAEVFNRIARWGADTELKACCDVLKNWGSCLSPDLRTARRPKPPSLKEQALAKTDAILNDTNRILLVEVRETLELNRRALEALDD